MSLMDVIAAFLSLAGQILSLYSKGQLTQGQLDAAVGALHAVPPPKEDCP